MPQPAQEWQHVKLAAPHSIPLQVTRTVGKWWDKKSFMLECLGHIFSLSLLIFAGIGSGKAPLHQCTELAQRPGVRQQWLSCRHLIIDEISMVEGEFFDKLEAVARCVERSLLGIFLHKH